MIEGGIWDEQSRQQFKQFYIVSIDYKEASETKNCRLRNLPSNKTNSARENNTNLQLKNNKKYFLDQ